MLYYYYYGLPWWLIGKESTCYAGATGDMGSIPGRGRSPGGGSWQGHGNPLQYSCLENPMDRGAWKAAVHRVTKSRTWLKRLSMHTLLLYYNEETFQQVLWNADQRVFLEQKSIKLNLSIVHKNEKVILRRGREVRSIRVSVGGWRAYS